MVLVTLSSKIIKTRICSLSAEMAVKELYMKNTGVTSVTPILEVGVAAGLDTITETGDLDNLPYKQQVNEPIAFKDVPENDENVNEAIALKDVPKNDEDVQADIIKIKSKVNEMTNIDIDNLEADMAKVTIREERFYCPLCGAGYKREGHLNNHMIKKHQHDHELKKMVLQCPECENFLSSKQALEKIIPQLQF